MSNSPMGVEAAASPSPQPDDYHTAPEEACNTDADVKSVLSEAPDHFFDNSSLAADTIGLTSTRGGRGRGRGGRGRGGPSRGGTSRGGSGRGGRGRGSSRGGRGGRSRGGASVGTADEVTMKSTVHKGVAGERHSERLAALKLARDTKAVSSLTGSGPSHVMQTPTATEPTGLPCKSSDERRDNDSEGTVDEAFQKHLREINKSGTMFPNLIFHYELKEADNSAPSPSPPDSTADGSSHATAVDSDRERKVTTSIMDPVRLSKKFWIGSRTHAVSTGTQMEIDSGTDSANLGSSGRDSAATHEDLLHIDSISRKSDNPEDGYVFITKGNKRWNLRAATLTPEPASRPHSTSATTSLGSSSRRPHALNQEDSERNEFHPSPHTSVGDQGEEMNEDEIGLFFEPGHVNPAVIGEDTRFTAHSATQSDHSLTTVSTALSPRSFTAATSTTATDASGNPASDIPSSLTSTKRPRADSGDSLRQLARECEEMLEAETREPE